MDNEDIEKYQMYGGNLLNASGDRIFFERRRSNLANGRSNNPLLKVGVWMSYIDPLSTMMIGLPVDSYGSARLMGYRVSMDLRCDDDHFLFKSVYRIVHVPYIRGEATSSVESFARALKDATIGTDLSMGNDLCDLLGGNWRNPPEGYLYLVMEGGGPLDGISNNVTVVSNVEQLENNNFSAHLLNTGEYSVAPTRGSVCMVNKPQGTEYNEIMEGTMLVRPTNAMGYVRGYLSFSEREDNWRQRSYSYEEEIGSIVKQFNERYHPYTGWIPDDLTRVTTETELFSLVEVDREPKAYFGNDLIERMSDRLLHFKGAVSVLVGNKRHNISPGCYFLLPKDDDIMSMDMLSYDALVEELLEQVVMSTSSSRSQAITNRITDIGDGVVKTSITPRGLSGKANGDSGFIARPTLRKLR